MNTLPLIDITSLDKFTTPAAPKVAKVQLNLDVNSKKIPALGKASKCIPNRCQPVATAAGLCRGLFGNITTRTHGIEAETPALHPSQEARRMLRARRRVCLATLPALSCHDNDFRFAAVFQRSIHCVRRPAITILLQEAVGARRIGAISEPETG
jgi:hypothetical protein